LGLIKCASQAETAVRFILNEEFEEEVENDSED